MGKTIKKEATDWSRCIERFRNKRLWISLGVDWGGTEIRKPDDCLLVFTWTRETHSLFLGSSKYVSSQAYSSQAKEWKIYIQAHFPLRKKRPRHRNRASSTWQDYSNAHSFISPNYMHITSNHIFVFSLKNGQQRDCKILDEGFQREKKKPKNTKQTEKGT